MARKPKRKRRSQSTARKDSAALRARVIEAALALAARDGWAKVSLVGVAARARAPLGEILGLFPSKAAIVNGIFRDIDEQVLAQGPAEGDSARDRLFDVLMRRFDALAPRKRAIAAILRDTTADPLACLCALLRLERSMAWMLEAANLSSGGIIGAMRTKGLTAVYAAAVRAWLADDSKDLAKTMAALDRGLKRAESVARLCRSLPVPGFQESAPEKSNE